MLDNVRDEPLSNRRSGGRNQQVARAGEYFVAAEICKRGAYAVTFAGNMPEIDVIACSTNRSRTVYIQVKTKRRGKTWHANVNDGKPMRQRTDEVDFWVFVDLGEMNTGSRYWVVPDEWIRNDIHEAHQAYLARRGGKRARNQESTHHAINEDRLKQWQDRWDILQIFE